MPKPVPEPVSQHQAVSSEPGLRVGPDPISRQNDRIVGRILLPLSSDRLSEPPTCEVRDAVERSNAALLGFLLQEVDLEAMPRPADERLAAAVAPLRLKLDMLIDMIARVCYRGVTLPRLCEVELGPRCVAWTSQHQWTPGDWARLSLYFDSRFREPIALFARVSACAEQSCKDGWHITAELVEPLASTGERLARLALLTRRQQQTGRRPLTFTSETE